MRRKLICAVALLTVAVVCGCSRQEPQGPQGALARRLRNADRVVFTHVLTNRPSLTLSNKQAKKIVRALKTSEEIESEGLCAIKEYTLVFFSGTNQLATIQASQIIFWIDDRPFLEREDGPLEAAYMQAVAEAYRSGRAF